MSDFVVYKPENGGLVKAWVRGVHVEDGARQQLMNAASMPFVHKWLAAMPDVHWGMGATIGSVIPTHRAIIPAAVGVDIGCGMMANRTSLTANDLGDNLDEMFEAISAVVPHGRTDGGGPNDKGTWSNPSEDAQDAWESLAEGYKRISDSHERVGRGKAPALHLGTLGTGNHFIEVCLDEDQRVWFMLHSGSRGVGNRIGMHFIKLARKDMEKWFINLPDKNLSYFPEGTKHFKDYVQAVHWAQDYARANREVMMKAVIRAVSGVKGIPPFQADMRVVNCHHNYVAKESHYGANVWVTRKGAVRARKGDLGIIPGNMGARSFIVRGKGNKESFNSCSHGAGRLMSRTDAKKKFSLEDHARDTAGVVCRKDAGVLDETPGAYKDIDAVMKAQESLVDIVHTLKQVVCVKG